MNWACTDCGFKLWLPIATLERSHLGLYDDARFPGRCLLVFDRHEEALHELGEEEACRFFEDARRAARAIMHVASSPRVNYAVLGNTQPHLHWHLIPRRPDVEPKAQRPPWEHPEPLRPLDPDEVTRLTEGIRAALLTVG